MGCKMRMEKIVAHYADLLQLRQNVKNTKKNRVGGSQFNGRDDDSDNGGADDSELTDSENRALKKLKQFENAESNSFRVVPSERVDFVCKRGGIRNV